MVDTGGMAAYESRHTGSPVACLAYRLPDGAIPVNQGDIVAFMAFHPAPCRWQSLARHLIASEEPVDYDPIR